MTSRDLNRILDDAAKVLAKAKAKVGISTNTDANNTNDNDNQLQQILEIGRRTQCYEINLDMITNYLPSVPAIDLERYPKYYSELEERVNREIKDWEDVISIAKANAREAGIANPRQYVEEYAQDCKRFYLAECERKKELLKQIKMVIYSDGPITSTNTETGETARYTNDFNLIE